MFSVRTRHTEVKGTPNLLSICIHGQSNNNVQNYFYVFNTVLSFTVHDENV